MPELRKDPVVGRHHANITRLLAGHEPKLGQRRSA